MCQTDGHTYGTNRHTFMRSSSFVVKVSIIVRGLYLREVKNFYDRKFFKSLFTLRIGRKRIIF